MIVASYHYQARSAVVGLEQKGPCCNGWRALHCLFWGVDRHSLERHGGSFEANPPGYPRRRESLARFLPRPEMGSEDGRGDNSSGPGAGKRRRRRYFGGQLLVGGFLLADRTNGAGRILHMSKDRNQHLYSHMFLIIWYSPLIEVHAAAEVGVKAIDSPDSVLRGYRNLVTILFASGTPV